MTAPTAVELLSQFQSGETTSLEATRSCIDRIEAEDGEIGAFLHVFADRALEQASQVDRRRAAGEPLGALAGVPIAIKDVLCTQGLPTTCGSRMLESFKPPYSATVVEKLLAADAVLIGKTNMDEFAMGSSTENSALKASRNPWDRSRVPGGSSGGAASCVAAGMAPLSLGSDTGGSIRQPAAFCGVVGMKPTYGRVSRYGLVAFASSLDQIGPLARTAEDAALLFDVIAGHDKNDSTSAPEPPPNCFQTVKEPFESLTIGLVEDHFGEGLNDQAAAAVQEAVKVYQSLGARIKSVRLPHNQYAIAAYYVVAPCEASSNLARYDGVHYGYRADEKKTLDELAEERKSLEAAGKKDQLEKLDSALVRLYRQSRSEGFGPEVKRRIMLGTFALSHGYYDAYYLKALKVRRLIRRDYDEAFGEVDLLLGPVTPTPAFKLGEKVDDPLSMYLGDLFTVGANMAGVAAMSLPCGFTSDGLPLGLHLQAPPFAEDRLLRAAHQFQRATDWHARRPTLA